MQVKIDVTGAREAGLVIDRMRDRVENPQAMFREKMIPILERNEKAAFASGGSSQGASWKDIQRRTADRKGNSRVLVASGKLMRAMTNSQDVNNRTKVTSTELRFGVNSSKSKAYSKSGTGYAWYVSKSRPFARASSATANRLTETMLDHVMGRWT